jgi:hypothetical protein
MCLGVVLAGFGVAMLAAPPTLLFIKDTMHRHAPRLAFADDHVTVSFVGGGSWAKPGLGWVHSESVEALKGRLYAELNIDHFDFSDLGSAQFQTIRAGYLLHPWSSALGGATIGYRRARGDNVQDAVEVGLPLVMGSQRGWARLVPTYVISSTGVTWTYRFQGEFPISGTRLVAGCNLEGRTLHQGGVYFGTLAFVLGIRL